MTFYDDDLGLTPMTKRKPWETMGNLRICQWVVKFLGLLADRLARARVAP